MKTSKTKQELPIEDAVKFIPVVGLLVDLIGDIFQRSPEKQRTRQLRKLRRDYERRRNPISFEEYTRRKQMIENEFDLTKVIASGEVSVISVVKGIAAAERLHQQREDLQFKQEEE